MLRFQVFAVFLFENFGGTATIDLKNKRYGNQQCRKHVKKYIPLNYLHRPEVG